MYALIWWKCISVMEEECQYHTNYASRRSRTKDTVKLTVCVCVLVLAESYLSCYMARIALSTGSL